MPYLVGQVCKYAMRFLGKNGLEDLKKARHFLDKLIEVYYPMSETPSSNLHPDSTEAAAAARQRADVYANKKPNDDVPPGWILEEASTPGTWHFRHSGGMFISGKLYDSRSAALEALLKIAAAPSPA